MTVKELKEQIKDLPDNAKIMIDFEYFSGELGWGSMEQDDSEVLDTEFFAWGCDDICPSEFHLKTFKEN